jgi:hypothetical protein
MNVKYSFVCDAANISQTGNINVLGIFKNIFSSQFPCAHPKFTYVANIEFHRTEIGKHKFKITFIDEDGKKLIPSIDSEIDVQPQNPFENPWTNFLFEFANINFPKAGIYEINLAIDNIHLCTDTITVVEANPVAKIIAKS